MVLDLQKFIHPFSDLPLSPHPDEVRTFMGCHRDWAVQFTSFQFSRSVVSNCLWPHKSQHARPPCPSPTPGVHSDSCPSSQWRHPAISSSVVPFSSCPQSLPASVFSNEANLCMRWPKYWSFRFSIILPKEIPGLISFRMDRLDLLASKGLSRVFSNTTVQKHQFFGTKLSLWSYSHIHTRILNSFGYTDLCQQSKVCAF